MSWPDVPSPFIERYNDVLPLLTHGAYATFLPAWLRQALRFPDGPTSRMLQVNLRHKPDTNGFTPTQARAIIDVASYIASHNSFGPTDPVNTESMEEIRRVWGSVAV